MPYNKLTPEEAHIIVDRGTESPFSGEYDNFYQEGTFICRHCNTPLFSSHDKFDSGCGWPSFSSELPHAIKKLTDADGYRTEIRCLHCDAHLGHLFLGENLTPKNTRHCVNSLSIRFIPKGQPFPKILNKI